MDKLTLYLHKWKEVEEKQNELEALRKTFKVCSGSTCHFDIPRVYVAYYLGVPWIVATNEIGQIVSVTRTVVELGTGYDGDNGDTHE